MPHACPECQKSFKTASSLASHCKAKRHRLPERSAPPPSAPLRTALPVIKANNAQDAQCPPLNKSFGVHCTRCPVWVADRDGLIQHWEKRHASEKKTGVFSLSPSSTARVDPGQGERHATPQASKQPPAARESSNLHANSSIATPPATTIRLDTLRHSNPCIAQDFKKQTEAGKRCPVCNVGIENKSQHYSEAHPHLKCDDCDRVFESSDELERHVRDTPDHNSCTFCSVSFKSQETLECCQHIVRCHAGEPSPAECLVCRKEYRSVDVLSEHIKAVHQAGNPGVVRTVNGVVQYCLASGPSAPRSKPGAASAVSPRECTADEVCTDLPAALTCEQSQASGPDFHSTPDTSKTDSSPPLGTANAPTVAETCLVPDVSQGKSGPTRDEDASHIEGSLAAPGGRERPSSLVVSDADSWSEIDGVSEADFVSVEGDEAAGGGPGSEIASEGLGEVGECSDSGVDGCEGAMSVSASGGLTDSSPCEPSVAPSNETRQPEAQARNTAGDPTRTSPSVPALVCKVCSSAPASPMVTMCGHVFCRGCIIAEITKNLCCPTCKHPILVEIKI